MTKLILLVFMIFNLSISYTLSQKAVKVIHTFKGEGTIGANNIVIQLNMQSNGIIKGFYSFQNSTFFLQGNHPLGESQQTTVYISQNDVEKGYLIIPYDIQDLEILIGKWYSIDGTKTLDLNVKRIH